MSKVKLSELVADAIDRIKQDGLIGFTVVAQKGRDDGKVHIYPVYSESDYEYDWTELRGYYDIAQETDKLKTERDNLTASIAAKKKEVRELDKALAVLRKHQL